MNRRGFLTATLIGPLVAGLAPLIGEGWVNRAAIFGGARGPGKIGTLDSRMDPETAAILGYGPDGEVWGLEAMVEDTPTFDGITGSKWDVYADWADV